MIKDSFKLNTLLSIYEAMREIKEVDRSSFFNLYFKEVKEQINNLLP
jgi:hypothetical protein